MTQGTFEVELEQITRVGGDLTPDNLREAFKERESQNWALVDQLLMLARNHHGPRDPSWTSPTTSSVVVVSSDTRLEEGPQDLPWSPGIYVKSTMTIRLDEDIFERAPDGTINAR